MFNNFIIGVLAFLLMIFPNWGSVQYEYLARTNSASIVAPKIIEAIKSNDIDTLESMMCGNIKKNTKNLHGEIKKMLDAIEGTITKIERRPGGGSYTETRKNGDAISQVGLDFTITTTKQTYAIGGCWEVANTFNKKEVGFRTIGLGTLDPLKSLVSITATDGIRSWHD